MARTRVGLNNPACQDYFNNKRFAAPKEIQQRRTSQFKIKKVTPQSKVVNV